MKVTQLSNEQVMERLQKCNISDLYVLQNNLSFFKLETVSLRILKDLLTDKYAVIEVEL